jgi:hypothetical protein
MYIVLPLLVVGGLVTGLIFLFKWIKKRYGSIGGLVSQIPHVANLKEGLKSLKSLANTSIGKAIIARLPTKAHARGVGTIPTECGADEDKYLGLCYKKCPDGYERYGMACKGICKDGWSSKKGTGACWPENRPREDYWKKEKCLESEDGKARGCERCGAFRKWYPLCPQGYAHRGPLHCDRCRRDPMCPDGWKSNIAGGCMRPRRIQRGVIRHACAGDKVKQFGLCYSPCPPDKPHGMGPFCYANRNDADQNANAAESADKKVVAGAVLAAETDAKKQEADAHSTAAKEADDENNETET